MKTHITLQERLRDLRDEKHLSLTDIENATGISSSTMSEYENDDTKGIPYYALVQLADFYDVSLDYLFDRSSSRTNSTKDISELNLDDKTIEILKSKKINNRLLCEFISHPNFRDLLADIEIYIDGTAGLYFQTINASVNALHEQIVKSFNPDKDDILFKILEASKPEECNYFKNRINTELSPILDDLRAAHIADPETATDTSLKDIVQINLPTIQISTEDSDEDIERLYFNSFCSTSGINPTSVPADEYNAFKKLMHRSKKYKEMLKAKKNTRKVKRLKERKEKNSES